MTNIGHSQETGLVYAGTTSNWGHVMAQQPLVLAAQLVGRNFSIGDLGNPVFEMPGMIFLDDAFDPVTRVRKGRLYKQFGSQPQPWYLAQPGTSNPPVERMFTWGQFSLDTELKELKVIDPILVLGSGEDKTFWDLISIERAIDSTAIVFLRARQSLGLLPEIDYSLVPDAFVEHLSQRVDVLLRDIRTASDESIVDSSREVMTCLLSAKLNVGGGVKKGKDLGQLVALLEESTPRASTASLAHVIARLHPRRKLAEVHQGFRRVDSQDAELSVNAVSFVLKEFGWAK
jgi:hypothetical protein